jgi:GNAT superfamily N-acetyltransferase
MDEYNSKKSLFNNIHIVLASKSDLKIIHDLAHQIWPITYKEIISGDQIAYMLNWMYALDVLERNFKEGQDFYIAFEGNRPLGFMALEYNYENESTVKLQKLYVLPTLHGKGIGRLLVNKAKEVSILKNYKQIVLNVNKQNPACQFYLKQGFKVDREEILRIGEGFVMDDYIMNVQL